MPLYSPKANTVRGVLEIIGDAVKGFAASSLFEAKLSRAVLGRSGSVHMTNPGLRPREVAGIPSTCDYLAFNSLSQWAAYREPLAGRIQCGLRINPGMSLVRDLRYDPCRESSKLGVPLDHVQELQDAASGRLDGISGLHFHTNSEATTFSGLLATVQHVKNYLGPLLDQVDWINIGGGYLFDSAEDMDEFHRAADLLRSAHKLDVFVEPGTAMVRRSCFLVSTVVDVFATGGKTVAVLDTTVNHWPEVFEYDFEPDVIGDTENGKHDYVLAGGTCLAGDIFGTYAFETPLEIGSRVVFANAGAYSLVKAHFFNGINLPAVYALRLGGEFVLKKRFTYSDFVGQWGEDQHATV